MIFVQLKTLKAFFFLQYLCFTSSRSYAYLSKVWPPASQTLPNRQGIWTPEKEINFPCLLHLLNYYSWIYWDSHWELYLFSHHALQQGFLKRRSFQEAEILRQLYSSSFPDLYRFSIQSLQWKTEMLEAFVIMQSINMLQGLIPPKVKSRRFFYIYLI